MQINEERLVERMWVEFSAGKTVTNSVCSDFFFTVIRPDRNLRHLNAFEVLDTIVNCVLPAGHERKRRLRRSAVLATPASTPVASPAAPEREPVTQETTESQ